MAHSTLPTLALALAALTVSIPAQMMTSERLLPFDSFADEYRSSHGLDPSVEVKLEGILDQHYARLRVGCLDVHFPIERLASRASFKQLKAATVGILDMQTSFADWLRPGFKKDKKSPAAILRKWLVSWRESKLRRGLSSKPKERDLYALLGASESVKKAGAAFAEAMASGKAWGQETDGERTDRLLLCPDRGCFLETMCFLGTTDAANRNALWVPDLVTRTESWIVQPVSMRVVALEYAHPSQQGSDFTTGLDMNSREKNGLQQHVVHSAASALARLWFSDTVDPVFVAGITTNLVIEVCGEDNTRTAGDGRGRVALARSVFVPGGRPEGGLLAPINLDSRWRAGKSRDHFVKPLQRGLKAGRKKVRNRKERSGSFLLRNENQSQELVLRAPFLGKAAADQDQVPGGFAGDFQEFGRAYSSAFVHWLRQRGTGKAGRAAKLRFAELLRALVDSTTSLEGGSNRLYGIPLSAAPGSKGKSLEWNFVRWLTK